MGTTGAIAIAATTTGWVVVRRDQGSLIFELPRTDLDTPGSIGLQVGGSDLFDLDARFGLAVAATTGGVSVLTDAGWTGVVPTRSGFPTRTAALYRSSGPVRVAAYSAPDSGGTDLDALDSPFTAGAFVRTFPNITITRVRPTDTGEVGLIAGSMPDGSVMGLVSSTMADLTVSAAAIEAVASGEEQLAAVAVRSGGRTRVYSPQTSLTLSSVALVVESPPDAGVLIAALAVQGARVAALVSASSSTPVGVGFGPNVTAATQLSPDRAVLLISPNEIYSLPGSAPPYGLAMAPGDGGLAVLHGRPNDGGTVLLLRQ